MKQKIYYEIARKQKKKNRKKLIRTLRKAGYDQSVILRLIDAMAGDTHYGKELNSGEILRMIADGASADELIDYADRLANRLFLYEVSDGSS